MEQAPVSREGKGATWHVLGPEETSRSRIAAVRVCRRSLLDRVGVDMARVEGQRATDGRFQVGGSAAAHVACPPS